MKSPSILQPVVSTACRHALALVATSFFTSASVFAQSGNLQITPDPPRIAAPPLLPSSPPLRTPLPPDYIPKRTPQFEVWRNGDTAPFVRPLLRPGNGQVPVRITSGDGFAIRLVLPGLAVGTPVLTQAIGHLKLLDSPDGQPISVRTDASGLVTLVMTFAQTGREGSLVVSIDGVRTVLRLRRNSP